jgi:hypothetical protein
MSIHVWISLLKSLITWGSLILPPGASCPFGAPKERLCSREAEAMRRRLEERADLFTEVFGREVELVTTLNGADYE